MRRTWLPAMLLLCVACSKKEIPAGALKVTVNINGFAPGCVWVTAKDSANHTSKATLNALARGDAKVLALEGPWAGGLTVTAQAFERTCGDHPVAAQTQPATVPSTGIGELAFTLTATDDDQDGYEPTSAGGTDCNDSPDGGNAFNPGVAEICDGLDNNCDGHADEGVPTKTYYRDVDGDGYGRNDNTQVACRSPGAGWVEQNDDCDDTNPAIHPGATEICNGKDDNCDGQKDEGLNLNAACTTAGGCSGKNVCDLATSSVVCSAPDYYPDRDQDQHGDMNSGPVTDCTQFPVVLSHDDCNDYDNTTYPNATELCDQRDNTCGTGTEDSSCPAGAAWTVLAPSPSSEWHAASAYGRGNVWFAGDSSKVVLRTGGAYQDMSGDCTGTNGGNWKASSVDGSGTVYLAGESAAVGGTGQVVQLTLAGACTPTSIVATPSIIQGVYGAGADVFAVTANGTIYHNDLTSPVAEGGALNGIHGISATDVIAVGTTSDSKPAAYHWNGTAWTDLGAKNVSGAPSSGALYGVFMLDHTHAYLVGDNMVMFWNGSSLSMLPSPNNTHIAAVLAFNPGSVYVTGWDTRIHRWDGTQWSQLEDANHSFFAITGVAPDDLWASGSSNLIDHWHEP